MLLLEPVTLLNYFYFSHYLEFYSCLISLSANRNAFDSFEFLPAQSVIAFLLPNCTVFNTSSIKSILVPQPGITHTHTLPWQIVLTIGPPESPIRQIHFYVSI